MQADSELGIAWVANAMQSELITHVGNAFLRIDRLPQDL